LGIESLVLGPARDRIMGIATAVGRDLDSTPYESRGELLGSWSRRYDADFFLVDPRGRSLAGGEVELPQPLRDRMQVRMGPRETGPGGGGPPMEPGERKGRGPDEKGPGNFRAGRGGPGLGPPRGLPSEQVFLTITRKPVAYWVGVRIPTNGPQGERGVPAVLLLRADSAFNSKLFFDWRPLFWLVAALAAIALLCWWPFIRHVTGAIRQMEHAAGEI